MTDKKLLNAKTKSPEDIAKHHNVDLDHIMDQIHHGMKIELEHTSHRSVAREIALDHLGEDPNYYTKLKKMEKS